MRVTKLLAYGFSLRRSYQILGVGSHASPQQIKNAYYAKAKLHHPDLNPSSSGSSFNEIRNAYQELMRNTSKPNDFRNRSQQNDSGWGNQDNFQDFDEQELKDEQEQDTSSSSENKNRSSRRKNRRKNSNQSEQFMFQTEQEMKQFQKAFNSYLRNGYIKKKYKHFEKIFQQMMFGSDFTFGFDDAEDYLYRESNQKQRKKHRLKNLDIAITLNLTQFELNKEMKIKLEREVNCYTCTYKPEKNWKKINCKKCHKGKKPNRQQCQSCDGLGYTQKYQCKLCSNNGYVRKMVEQVVYIPQNIKSFNKIVLEGKGNQHRKNGLFGDLVINIKLKKGQEDERAKGRPQSNKRENIIQLNPFEAILGCTKKVTLMDKDKIEVKIPPGSQPGDTIKHRGSSKNYERLKIQITIPLQISSKEKEIYNKLRQLKQSKASSS